MRRTLIATALVAGLAAVLGTHAFGQTGSGPRWATVNSCAPTAVGVRASLPGDGTGKQMRVRFTAQYLDPRQGAWVPVKGIPTSPWIGAGSARYSYGQAGWTFRLAPGSHGQIRGVAEMQWLEGGRVVRSSSSVSQGGVASDVGGSQAVCRF